MVDKEAPDSFIYIIIGSIIIAILFVIWIFYDMRGLAVPFV